MQQSSRFYAVCNASATVRQVRLCRELILLGLYVGPDADPNDSTAPLSFLPHLVGLLDASSDSAMAVPGKGGSHPRRSATSAAANTALEEVRLEVLAALDALQDLRLGRRAGLLLADFRRAVKGAGPCIQRRFRPPGTLWRQQTLSHSLRGFQPRVPPTSVPDPQGVDVEFFRRWLEGEGGGGVAAGALSFKRQEFQLERALLGMLECGSPRLAAAAYRALLRERVPTTELYATLRRTMVVSTVAGSRAYRLLGAAEAALRRVLPILPPLIRNDGVSVTSALSPELEEMQRAAAALLELCNSLHATPEAREIVGRLGLHVLVFKTLAGCLRPETVTAGIGAPAAQELWTVPPCAKQLAAACLAVVPALCSGSFAPNQVSLCRIPC